MQFHNYKLRRLRNHYAIFEKSFFPDVLINPFVTKSIFLSFTLNRVSFVKYFSSFWVAKRVQSATQGRLIWCNLPFGLTILNFPVISSASPVWRFWSIMTWSAWCANILTKNSPNFLPPGLIKFSKPEGITYAAEDRYIGVKMYCSWQTSLRQTWILSRQAICRQNFVNKIRFFSVSSTYVSFKDHSSDGTRFIWII